MSSKDKKELSPDLWEKVMDAHAQAKELGGNARKCFVEAQEEPIREELEYLLAHDGEMSSFMEGSPSSTILSLLTGGNRLPEPLNPGDRIADFQVMRLLGEGAIARVYLARQLSLDRIVALKVSRSEGREARLLASLDHPGVVRVYAETEVPEKELRLMAMQYVPGCDLRVLLTRAAASGGARSGADVLAWIDQDGTPTIPLSSSGITHRESLKQLHGIELWLLYVKEIAEALAHAHANGLLHLDIKPENLLVNVFGEILLSDFNVSVSSRKGEEAVGGTPGYMSPELRDYLCARSEESPAGHPVDARTDIFSLGVVAEEMWTSFVGPRETGSPTMRASLERQVHAYALDLIRRCTSASPEERPRSAGTVAKAAGKLLSLLRLGRRIASVPTRISFERLSPFALLLVTYFVISHAALTAGMHYKAREVAASLDAAGWAWFLRASVMGNVSGATAGHLLFFAAWLRVRRGASRLLADWVDGDSEPLRKTLLRLPLLAALTQWLIWIPGQVITAVTLKLLGPPIPAEFYFHFAITCFLFCILASSACYLVIQLATLSRLYFSFLIGCTDPISTAGTELAVQSRRSLFASAVVAVVPLVAGALWLSLAPDVSTPVAADRFRLVLCRFLMEGVAGILFGLWAKERLARPQMALTRDSR